MSRKIRKARHGERVRIRSGGTSFIRLDGIFSWILHSPQETLVLVTVLCLVPFWARQFTWTTLYSSGRRNRSSNTLLIHMDSLLSGIGN